MHVPSVQLNVECGLNVLLYALYVPKLREMLPLQTHLSENLLT